MNTKKGYFYGIKFHKEWLIRGIKELLRDINLNKLNSIVSYFPKNDEYFYVIYDENLIIPSGDIKIFEKCNHWIYIRQRLHLIFDGIIQKYICEFSEHPRGIFLF